MPARLGERAGDTRAEADRRALLSALVLVPLMLVELVASSIALAVPAPSEPMVWHLGVAAVVLLVSALTGVWRRSAPSNDETPASRRTS